MIKKYLLMIICFLLVSCSGGSGVSQQQAKALVNRLMSCLEANYQTKRTAPCAIDFFNGIQSWPDSDYGKPPALNYAIALYEAFLKFDRGQHSHSDTRVQIMYADNKFNQEMAEARRRNTAENIQIARYRQQMFIQAAQMLNPPRNGISCISQNNGFLTTTNCY